jgi:FtsH-binding integral membrane protein
MPFILITCLLVVFSIVFWALFHNMNIEKRKGYNLFFFIILIVSFVMVLILSPFSKIAQLQYVMIFSIILAFISLLGYLFSKIKQ